MSNIKNKSLKSKTEIQHYFEDPQMNDFAHAVVNGLNANQKSIPCQFLYDAQGSKLFEDITYVNDYYPSRTEIGLLERYAQEIIEHVPEQTALIEFGSGSSRKTDILLRALSNLKAYVPIDISDTALEGAKNRLKQAFPDLKVFPIHADFNQTMKLPEILQSSYHLGFFPGSTIGNFEKTDALSFLKQARQILGPESGFVVGVDLQKDLDILLPAYDDSQGVTADFNMNLLRRINSDLEANFDLSKFRHSAIYNEQKQRVEMHLVSLENQKIDIFDMQIAFKEGESIHTENSHKYTISGFHDLAENAGWRAINTWVDDNKLFSVHYLVPAQMN